MNINSVLTDIIKEINDINIKTKTPTIAIDGKCGAGKSTLAKELGERLSANIIHVDDFFLRPEQRTDERLSEPGGNVDYERFIEEVLKPLQGDKDFAYRPFSCKSMSLINEVIAYSNKITIIEGAYAFHPLFQAYYDYSIFLTINSNTQLERITQRNGESEVNIFKNKWIPMEEQYFNFFDIENLCDKVYTIDGSWR
ncbi:MAG: uridine kinase [Suipraeoptans sp.]